MSGTCVRPKHSKQRPKISSGTCGGMSPTYTATPHGCLLLRKSTFFSTKTGGRATTAVATAVIGAIKGRGGAVTIGA